MMLGLTLGLLNKYTFTVALVLGWTWPLLTYFDRPTGMGRAQLLTVWPFQLSFIRVSNSGLKNLNDPPHST